MNSSKLRSATADTAMSPAWKVLWLIQQGGDTNWRAAHEIAQSLPTQMGAWLHAHLHALEGDDSNARYWYARAEKPAVGLKDADAEFLDIAAHLEERNP